MLVSWSVRADHGRAHRALARQPGAAGGRNAVAPAGRRRRRARRRGRCARPAWSARASRSSRPTAASSAIPSSTARRSPRSRTTRRGRRFSRRARDGLGIARRYSTTLGADMLYVAVPVSNPALPALAIRPPGAAADRRRRAAGRRPPDRARRARRRPARRAGAGVGDVDAAQPARARDRRGRGALRARRLSRPARDYGTDEIGTVARVLDDSVRELGRARDRARADRARMEAILAGMIEGVLVVNDHGRLQLVNDAARAMLQLQDDAGGPALPRDRPPARHRRAARRGAARHGRPTASS